MQDKIFKLRIVSKEGVVYDGEAFSITSYNESGRFDVLSQHANFISLISREITLRDLGGKVRKILIKSALLRVRENNVEIYIGFDNQLGSQIKPSEFAIREGIVK